MENLFSGVVSLKGLPDVMIIVDPRKEVSAVLEAKRLGVPTVALANTDCDITDITYPVVANDASRASIEFIVKQFADAFKGNKAD